MHEDFTRAADQVRGGSDRSFGLVMAAAFTVAALAPLRHHLPVRGWALAVAAGFMLAAAARPSVLRPLNRAWTAIARALNRITSPVLMALVYGIGIVPLGVVMRLAGRDPMRRARDAGAATYWIRRADGGTDMRRQF